MKKKKVSYGTRIRNLNTQLDEIRSTVCKYRLQRDALEESLTIIRGEQNAVGEALTNVRTDRDQIQGELDDALELLNLYGKHVLDLELLLRKAKRTQKGPA